MKSIRPRYESDQKGVCPEDLQLADLNMLTTGYPRWHPPRDSHPQALKTKRQFEDFIRKYGPTRETWEDPKPPYDVDLEIEKLAREWDRRYEEEDPR